MIGFSERAYAARAGLSQDAIPPLVVDEAEIAAAVHALAGALPS